MSMNVVVIEGRLVADSEVKTSVNGKVYTNMRIAHNSWNSAKQEEEVKYFSVRIYKEKPMEKGTPILARGSLDFYQYDDGGEKKSVVYIMAYEVIPFYIKKPESTVSKAKAVFQDDQVPF